ncbi:transglycosylase SLT domain-containing protein [Providencia sp. wls1919]|nr:transglycosylase SLT domain-containing protein [Providencia sp. wls1919]
MKFLVLFLFLTASFSNASQLDCFDMAGRDYNIDPDLLRAISWQESNFNQSAISPKNWDGSYDIGKMQINSKNIAKLGVYGITQEGISNDHCLNIYTGAYILALSFKQMGVNWEAVGAYNAGFRKTEKQKNRRLTYASSIQKKYLAIKKSKGK